MSAYLIRIVTTDDQPDVLAAAQAAGWGTPCRGPEPLARVCGRLQLWHWRRPTSEPLDGYDCQIVELVGGPDVS